MGEEPHPHTRFALVFSISPLIFIPLSFLCSYFCYAIPAWGYISIPVVLILFMYYLKYKGVFERIEKEKPMIFGSSKASGIFAIVFWVLSFTLLLYGGVESREYYWRRVAECASCK